MKKPNLQRLAQRSKIYLRKASPTILSGLGAAGVIVTSVLAVRATPKALRKIRADSKTNHDGDPEAYSKLEAVKSAWVCYIPAAISGTATIFCISTFWSPRADDNGAQPVSIHCRKLPRWGIGSPVAAYKAANPARLVTHWGETTLRT